MPDTFKKWLNKWAVPIGFIGAGGMAAVCGFLVKLVHISETPERMEKLETRMAIQESNGVSKAEFFSVTKDMQTKLNDHGVSLGNINGKLDVLLQAEYPSAAHQSYGDIPPAHGSAQLMQGKEN